MAENQMIPKPSLRKLPRQVDKDTGVFCRYHQYNGHDTESCIALRRIIEKLISEGKLDQYLNAHSGPEPPGNRQINMISGGTPIADSSRRSAKSYIRAARHPQVFSLTEERNSKIRRLGWEPITFSADISDFDVGRILIDTGSSVNVLFADAFDGLGIGHQSLNKEITPLLSFSGDVVEPIGSIQLPLAIGSGQRRAFIYTHFLVVSCPTAYNAIIGRPALTRMKAILCPHMLLLKFPSQLGIGQVRGDQLSAWVCYVSSTTKAANQTPRQGIPETLAVAHPSLPNGRGGTDPPDDPRDDSATPQAQPVEELETISLSDVQNRQVRIGTSLGPSLRSEFISFLRANSEVFAWSYDDMPGISPSVISHKLSISPSFKPVRQKRRSYDTERYEAMKAEVDKLLVIGFIREVTYPTWLANSVLVKKSSGAWRMCQDYTNLNKACPKDSFPLPRIDQLVDAYSGYNQIFMHPTDREHTAFITDRGLYCYNVMPFGLKNAGATYQRLVNQIFAELIGTSMEVYVDDMLVKSRTANDHLRNLALMFGKLKQYNMRLNPSKCAFGVASGKFLGFMISQRGIEANPDKIRALLDMQVPKTKKEVQSLTGLVAALSRFISKATDRCAPFFKALKGSKRQVDWTSECDRAFDDLKRYMSRAPLLSTPLPGETLDAEQRYPQLEQLAYALVLSARRLRPYFQGHSINVLTNQPLRQVLQKPETSGRLIKWAIELGEFDIAETAFDHNAPHWTLYVDGSSNRQGSGAGLVLRTPDHTTIEYAIRFQFRASNNEAEYEALLAGLRLAQHTGAERLLICSDS
ncbi:unnamed protein product [Prunus brigantina]